MTIARPFIVLACLGCTLLASTLSFAKEQKQQLRRGVEYIHDERKDPAQRVFAVVIDLVKSGAEIDVAGGGPDPDGEGEWETILKPVPVIAKNEGFDIAINGDFFSHLGGKDAEGAAALKEFKGDTPASVSGAAVSDGKVWSKTDEGRPAFVVTKSGKLLIVPSNKVPKDAEEAIAGSDVLVKNGEDVATREGSLSKTRHPRTAIGFRDGGKTLVLLVVDGRKKGVAEGMTFADLAAEMLRLGCDEAVNLDGGGSSTLVFRDSRKNEAQVMNAPSDGRPRAVANALGITFKSDRGIRIEAKDEKPIEP